MGESEDEGFVQSHGVPSTFKFIRVLRSYRELPIRLAEFGTVYRYEQSGELGTNAGAGFTQDDAHLFVTPEQLDNE